LKNSPQAVIFDLDETLIVEESSEVAAFMDVCRKAETVRGVKSDIMYRAIRQHSRSLWHNSPFRKYLVDIGIGSHEGLCTTFEGDYPNFELLRNWVPQFRIESWWQALLTCGVNDSRLALEMADTYLLNRSRYQTLHNDALPCLNRLSEQYPLALLTNGAPDLQYEKVTTTGIRKYFTKIAVSGEFGYGKPDRRIFEFVSSHLKVSPYDTWMVGDSLERDIAGAQALGIYAVWINRQGIKNDSKIIPDMEISSLDQLMTIIG
jgi:putative hydrolase of the HAD superfamily